MALRLASVGCVAAAGLVLVSAAGAAAAPRVELAFSGPADVAVTLTGKPRAIKGARLTLLLENRSARTGKLELRYLTKSLTLTATGAASGKRPALVVTPKPGTDVPARSVTRIALTFHFGSARKAFPAGTLVARLSGERSIGPATVKLAPKEAAPLAFAQTSATINVTRGFGPLSGFISEKCDCEPLYDGERITIGRRGDEPAEATTILNSDSGGSARVELKRDDKVKDEATLHVSELTARGKYSGDLVLDPEVEKPRKLALTANVRDFILWPLAFVLAGAAFSAYFVRRREVSRGADLIRRAIQEAVAPYLDARLRNASRPEGEQDPEERYFLDHLVPDQGSPFYSKKSCRQAATAGDQLTPVADLYCRSYDLDDDESLQDLVAAMKTTTDRFVRWKRVEDAVAFLRAEVRRIPDTGAAMKADAANMLTPTRQETDDDAETASLIDALGAEARVVAVYNHVRKRYDTQSETWQQARPSLDPDRKIERLADIPLWERNEAKIEAIERALLADAELLRNPGDIPADSDPSQQSYVDSVVAASGVSVAASSLSARERNVLDDARALPVPDTRNAAAIYRDVRRADWVVFWCVAALTALVYLSQKYDSDYGSFDDYLLAFAAGAVAPTAVEWALLPFSRSYRPGVEPPDKEKKEATKEA